MADGPFTFAELLQLPGLPVPASLLAPYTNFQFPTVHFRSWSTPRTLQLTTRELASQFRRRARAPAGFRQSTPSGDAESLRQADGLLFLLVRAGSIGWGEWGRTLYHNYLEQRELQQVVGRLIQERRIELLAVTSDAVTAPLREVWLVKYGDDGDESKQQLPVAIATINQGG